MINRQEIIRLIAFSFVIFTFFLNIICIGYVKYREINYSEYNAQVVTNFHDSGKYFNPTEGNLMAVCSSFKPGLFFPIYYTLSSFSSLMILISILLLIAIKIYAKAFNGKIFHGKDKYVLSIFVLASILILFQVFVIEPDYNYFGIGCTELL